MQWELIDYRTSTGKFNMEFDLNLIKLCKPFTPILRFYGWLPHCISLGANQSFSEIKDIKTLEDNIDVVKRPTGGRAIFHAEELTYSVIMPNSDLLSGRKLYEDISNAIVLGLKQYDKKLVEVNLESRNPNFSDLLKSPSGSICFASTAKSEIKFKGKKLVGSAQRKLGSTILQHGSILIGGLHKKLVNYLNVTEEEKTKLEEEINSKTTEISSIINSDVNIFQLQEKIVAGFEKIFNIEFFINKLETTIT
jgi:lipoate-protein ligase A